VPTDWIEALGIRDAATGAEVASAAREKILEPAKRVIGTSGDITFRFLVFTGFVSRAQCLHEAAVQMIAAENPHASFTLLRAYAENAAAILFANDHPNLVDNFLDIDGHGIKIGRITSYADKRFGEFKGIYNELSKFAHPQALGLLSSTSVAEARTLRWSSAPQFKRPEDQLIAYAWAVELAQATRHLLYEFAERYGLGYFGTPHGSVDEPPAPP
jgi:hypothetical protein